MAIETIRAENIEGGQMLAAVNEALGIIGEDVIDRYTIEKPRRVTVEIEIAPAVEIVQGAPRNMPKIDWSVKQSVPGQSGMTTRAFVDPRSGKVGLVFNTNDPMSTDPRQGTIFDGAESEPKKSTAP